MKYAPKSFIYDTGAEPVIGDGAADGSAERTLF